MRQRFSKASTACFSKATGFREMFLIRDQFCVKRRQNSCRRWYSFFIRYNDSIKLLENDTLISTVVHNQSLRHTVGIVLSSPLVVRTFAVVLRFAVHQHDIGLDSSVRGQHHAAIAPALRGLHSLRDIALPIHGDPFSDCGISVGITSLQVLDNKSEQK